MDYDKLIAEIEESAYVDYQGFKVVEFNEIKRIILDQKKEK